MKITFSNLGTIKKTELDLKPLTVIIGPNNTSKTYVAYSIHGIWRMIAESSYGPLLSMENAKLEDNGFSIPLANVVSAVRAVERNYVALFSRLLNGYFQDTSGKIFSKTRFGVVSDQLEIMSAINYALRQSSGFWEKAFLHGEKVHFAVTEKVPLEPRSLVVQGARRQFIQSVCARLYPAPLLLPAERNAFVITYKMLATRRFRMMRDAHRDFMVHREVDARTVDLLREQGDIRYPMPIEDFLDFLTDVELSDRSVVTKEKKSNPFRALALDIEAKIQNNNRTRLSATRFGGGEIKVDVKRSLSIDLYNASSSIKQLAPLLLFLRYRASENSFIIIDEPEMNLHPESQAKVLEALAIMVNLGVRVLLTTHSPYFMAHLNNLVAGNDKNPDVLKRQASSLYMNDERAFLPMDKVSAYEMKDGELISLKDDDYGIRWDTLSDVSAELQQRYFAIREAGEMKDGKGK